MSATSPHSPEQIKKKKNIIHYTFHLPLLISLDSLWKFALRFWCGGTCLYWLGFDGTPGRGCMFRPPGDTGWLRGFVAFNDSEGPAVPHRPFSQWPQKPHSPLRKPTHLLCTLLPQLHQHTTWNSQQHTSHCSLQDAHSILSVSLCYLCVCCCRLSHTFASCSLSLVCLCFCFSLFLIVSQQLLSVTNIHVHTAFSIPHRLCQTLSAIKPPKVSHGDQLSINLAWATWKACSELSRSWGLCINRCVSVVQGGVWEGWGLPVWGLKR